jgi:hypothetical protein
MFGIGGGSVWSVKKVVTGEHQRMMSKLMKGLTGAAMTFMTAARRYITK